MLLNEDYFKDLELTDDDISDNESSDIIQDYQDMESLDKHLRDKYKQCIVIESESLYNIYSLDELWNRVIPFTLKRLSMLFDLYNIEYEYIIRDTDMYKSDHCYKIGNFHIFTSATSLDVLYDSKYIRSLYIILYVNLPKFNYKQSYYFIDRLYNSVWWYWNDKEVSVSYFYGLYVTKKAYSVCHFGIEMPDMHSIEDKDILRLYTDTDYINHILPYKDFFKKALSFFNNSNSDIQAINNMFRCISIGSDPFAKES